MNLKSKNISKFFYSYWWLYYIIFFFLLGLLVAILLMDYKRNNINERIDYLTKKIDDCNKRNSIRDSIRVIDNRGEFGCLTFTLIWNTTDDLDILVRDVDKNIICFEKYCKVKDNKFSSAGGQLDIDNNIEGLISNEPVENIYFKCTPPNGIYSSIIHVYDKRVITPVNYKLIIRKNGVIVKEIRDKLERKNQWSKEIKFTYNAN
jgi:hypothetical protein